MASSSDQAPLLPGSLRAGLAAWLRGMLGYTLLSACLAAGACLLTWSVADPTFVNAASVPVRNALGPIGADVADLAMRLFGLASVLVVLPPLFWALQLITRRQLEEARMKMMLAPVAVLLLSCAVSALPVIGAWPLPYGLGGYLGDQSLRFLASLITAAGPERATAIAGLLCLVGGLILLTGSLGMSLHDLRVIAQVGRPRLAVVARAWHGIIGSFERDPARPQARREPTLDFPSPASAGARRSMYSAEPAFGRGPRAATADDRGAIPASKRVALREAGRGTGRDPRRDPEFDRTTEAQSRDMAQRFAPARDDETSDRMGFVGLLRRQMARLRAAAKEQPAADAGRTAGRSGPLRPIWPGSVPDPDADNADAVQDPGLGCGRGRVEDELYARAVALVRAQRKASTAYLQQSLGIGYMRAADLIDRMEREGIVGPPVHSGLRPILTPPPGTRLV
jgi:hypothetical protein